MAWPYRVDVRGQTAHTRSDAEQARGMIEQLLFTDPGERVNRPDFGCGLRALVFGPNGDALAGAVQFMVEAALQRWLDDVIVVDAVKVASSDATLEVTVVWRLRSGGERRVDRFTPPERASQPDGGSP